MVQTMSAHDPAYPTERLAGTGAMADYRMAGGLTKLEIVAAMIYAQASDMTASTAVSRAVDLLNECAAAAQMAKG